MQTDTKGYCASSQSINIKHSSFSFGEFEGGLIMAYLVTSNLTHAVPHRIRETLCWHKPLSIKYRLVQTKREVGSQKHNGLVIAVERMKVGGGGGG